jgi:heptosyltransferase-2
LRHPLAILFPGTLWETKHWHAAGFAEVARHLLATGRAVVLAGANAERPRCREVAERCPGVCDLSGQTTLAELAALIRRAAVCVTNDSGSMHLTAALGRPVVGIFGPTDPVWIGPYGRTGAVVKADLACAPCYLRQLRKCPNGHACMEQVTAGRVIARLEELLRAKAA